MVPAISNAFVRASLSFTAVYTRSNPPTLAAGYRGSNLIGRLGQ